MPRDDTKLTRALAIAICDAIDGPCICKAAGAPDVAFGGCWQAYQAALAARPHVVSATIGFRSLGPRPHAVAKPGEVR